MGKNIKHRSLWMLSGAIILLDQITKYLVVSRIGLDEKVTLIRNFAHLTFVTNTGAGFSILQGQNTVLILISATVLAILLYAFNKIGHSYRIFVMLIIAGTAGNLIDRIIFGYVIDFIQVWFWPIFNVADSAITIGALGTIVLLIMQKEDNKYNTKGKDRKKILKTIKTE